MEDNIFFKFGLKKTENRMHIMEILEENSEPMTAETIFVEMRKKHTCNFSTVYRILSILTEKGIVLKSTDTDKKAYFQMNNAKHNHYLTCMKCHKKIPIDGCPLEKMGRELKEKTGFRIMGHNLEFIGECPECIEKEKYDQD